MTNVNETPTDGGAQRSRLRVDAEWYMRVGHAATGVRSSIHVDVHENFLLRLRVCPSLTSNSHVRVCPGLYRYLPKPRRHHCAVHSLIDTHAYNLQQVTPHTPNTFLYLTDVSYACSRVTQKRIRAPMESRPLDDCNLIEYQR